MSQVNVGLIGYGLAGSVFHAPLIVAEPGMHLHSVVSSRRERIAEDLPQSKVVSEVDDLLADEAIELVVIASPNGSHASLAERALRAGKHVVVDKPFTIHSRDADALIALADERNRLLSVFQNRRWDADFLSLRRYLDEGRLGEVYHYEAHYDRFRPTIKHGWREQSEPGAGLLYDLGAHLIDQALQVFGWPEAVDADVAIQRKEAKVVDWYQLRLHYGAKRVVLGTSSLIAAAVPHFSVHGDSGSFVSTGLDGQEDALKQGRRPGMSGWGEAASWAGNYTDAQGKITSVTREAGCYEAFYRGIVASLRQDAPPPVTAQQSRDVIRLIETAQRSSDEARRIRL